MARFTVDRRSTEVLITGLRGATARVRAAKLVAVTVAGNVVTKRIQQNIGIPPIGGNASSHRAALAAADHPYATKHPTIQIAPSGGAPGFRDTELLVHTVSGRLLRSIKPRVKGGNSPQFILIADRRTAPHAQFVFQGTKVMHQRDILFETFDDRANRAAMLRAMVLILGRVFRTGASIRIG